MSDRPGRSRFVLAAVWLAAFPGPGCSKAPSAPPPSPPTAPIAVSGTLLEGYTGRPMTSGELILGHYTQGITFKAAFTARPDVNGRFRFDGVRTPEHLSLRWKPDEEAKKTVLGIKPEQLAEEHLQTTQSGPGWGDYTDVDLEKAAGQDVDLGTTWVWLDRMAHEAFAAVCETNRPAASTPAGTGVVVFWQWGRKDPFSLAGHLHQAIASAWPPGWKGVTCITQTEKKLGTYSQYGIGVGSAGAYSVTWSVRAIRLPDGKTFRTTISADPPQQIQVDSTGRPAGGFGSDVKGDPKPKLREWLKSLAT